MRGFLYGIILVVGSMVLFYVVIFRPELLRSWRDYRSNYFMSPLGASSCGVALFSMGMAAILRSLNLLAGVYAESVFVVTLTQLFAVALYDIYRKRRLGERSPFYVGNPKVQIIGVYRVPIDEALIEEAMDVNYPLEVCSEADRRQAQPGVVAEMSSAVLVEAIIEGADKRYFSCDFGQPRSQEAAYLETYLSRDGSAVISEYVRPPGDFLRVAFFLPFFDATKPLRTSYGKITLPQATAMPKRLSTIIRYEPVD